MTRRAPSTKTGQLGPRYAWEGFQLIGFQAAIFLSGSRGLQPIIVWITPSDATNLVLTTSSAVAQGAKPFFYWTYGPTAGGELLARELLNNRNLVLNPVAFLGNDPN